MPDRPRDYRDYLCRMHGLSSPEAMRCFKSNYYPPIEYYRQHSLADFYRSVADRYVRRFIRGCGTYHLGPAFRETRPMHGEVSSVVARVLLAKDERREDINITIYSPTVRHLKRQVWGKGLDAILSDGTMIVYHHDSLDEDRRRLMNELWQQMFD